jgi:hypothetical protein
MPVAKYLTDEKIQNRDNLCKKVFVSAENNVEYVANNPARHSIRHYRIDNDVISDKTTRKCDYLLVNDTDSDAWFIELKGSDIRIAREQVINTRRILSCDLRGYEYFYRIVYRSGTHNIHGSDIIRWKEKEGRARGRARVVLKERKLVEDIS